MTIDEELAALERYWAALDVDAIPKLLAEIRLLQAALPERIACEDESGQPDGTMCGLCACDPCESDCLLRPDRKLGEP